jgi:hypothetical protein
MRPQDIIIGESYRFRSNPNTGYAKALQVINPGNGINDKAYKIVKCEHTLYKGDKMGFIRYFVPSDLIKDNVK